MGTIRNVLKWKLVHDTVSRFISTRRLNIQTSNATSDFLKPNQQASASSASISLSQFLASLNDMERLRLEEYIIEYHLLKIKGSNLIPSRVLADDWKRILAIDTKFDRVRYFAYLSEKERKKARKMQKRQASDALENKLTEYLKKDPAGKNRIFLPWTFKLENLRNARLAHAMVFGPNMIIDLSLITDLRPIDWFPSARQMALIHHCNKMHRFPHHLIFAGCRRDHSFWEMIQRQFDYKFESSLLTVTEDHFLDLFPRERLIYLSPDAEVPLMEYDHEKVYISSCLVDHFARPNLTKRMAEMAGIETRKLPLDEIKYAGRKALCIYHVNMIMNDLHIGVKMRDALEKTLAPVQIGSEAAKKKRELKKLRYLELEKLAWG